VNNIYYKAVKVNSVGTYVSFMVANKPGLVVKYKIDEMIKPSIGSLFVFNNLADAIWFIKMNTNYRNIHDRLVAILEGEGQSSQLQPSTTPCLTSSLQSFYDFWNNPEKYHELINHVPVGTIFVDWFKPLRVVSYPWDMELINK
jgi:hypothetical protein